MTYTSIDYYKQKQIYFYVQLFSFKQQMADSFALIKTKQISEKFEVKEREDQNNT